MGAAMTADVFARAVIASAQVYGDDPAAAMTAEGHFARRCLTPAAAALADALGVRLRVICGPLGLKYDSAKVTRRRGHGLFDQAKAAAQRAITYAGWRPEARASVVALPIEVAPPPSPKPVRQAPPEPAPAFRPAPRELSADEDAQERAKARVRLARASATPATWDLGQPVLSDRVLEALAQTPASPSALATRLDVKEAPVTTCIRELARQGRIVAEAMPEAGARFQKWVLA